MSDPAIPTTQAPSLAQSAAEPQAPASAAPSPAAPLQPSEIPPGWELETQRLRRIKAGEPIAAKSIAPTAPVVGATIGSTVGPLIAYVASSIGHPIPPDVLIALTTVTTFLGGWFHPAGRK